MAKKTSFAGFGQSIIAETQQPATEPDKGHITTFKLDRSLLQPLERNVFWEGKKGSKQGVINAALAYYFEHSPAAKKKAEKPTPDEE